MVTSSAITNLKFGAATNDFATNSDTREHARKIVASLGDPAIQQALIQQVGGNLSAYQTQVGIPDTGGTVNPLTATYILGVPDNYRASVMGTVRNMDVSVDVVSSYFANFNPATTPGNSPSSSFDPGTATTPFNGPTPLAPSTVASTATAIPNGTDAGNGLAELGKISLNAQAGGSLGIVLSATALPQGEVIPLMPSDGQFVEEYANQPNPVGDMGAYLHLGVGGGWESLGTLDPAFWAKLEDPSYASTYQQELLSQIGTSQLSTQMLNLPITA